MPDGVRLAARLWIPRGAQDAPVPAIFEYIPYRKSDMVRARDERNHPFFAAHGYACMRVDMRGSGDSEGYMPDMYAENELSDARAVIDWLAAQPWCDGRVGMFGTSWGGTAGLQASVDVPEALAAVIAVCATHDRYEDDIHHKGGCLLTDTFEWGATLPAILALPPTRNVGDDWRERWEARLRSLAFPLEDWVREEARGDYLEAGVGHPRGRAALAPDPRRGRLVRRLLQLRDVAGRRPARSGLGRRRTLGAPLSRPGTSRASDRIPATGARLVGSLAAKPRAGRHCVAQASGLAQGIRSARRRDRDSQRPMD